MTQPAPMSGVTLEDVRARFVEAEAELNSAAATLARLESAITQLSDARMGLRDASGEIARFHGLFEEAVQSMKDSVQTLATGVDAIRDTQPAQVIQRIEQLSHTLAERDAVLAATVSGVVEQANHLTEGQRLLSSEMSESRKAVVHTVTGGFDAVETRQAADVGRLESAIAAVGSSLASGMAEMSSELQRVNQQIPLVLERAEEIRTHAGEMKLALGAMAGSSMRARMETRVLLLVILVLGVVSIALRLW